MPEPFSIGIYLVAGYVTLSAYARGSSAISSEARAAQKAATAVVESAERSQVLFGEKAVAISQLRSLADECSEQGWDGEEACALDPIAAFIAEAFVRALPDDIPLPEFAPEPDGSISLDWIQSRNRLFSLSVGTSHRLAYAWLDGADKGHAVARFDEKIVPPRVLEGIREIIKDGNASIRVA
jgi:hypothetical protein